MTDGTRVIQIPFPGFYDSWLTDALDSEEQQFAEYEAEQTGRDASSIGEAVLDCVDYGKAHAHLAKEWAASLALKVNSNLPDGCEPFALTYESMVSPREYNFSTDRLFCYIPLADLERMRALTSGAELDKAIADRCTSRSGFHSFYSNNLDAWNAKPLAEWDHNEAGILFLAFLAQHYDGGTRQLEADTLENMYENADFSRALDEALDYDALKARLSVPAENE